MSSGMDGNAANPDEVFLANVNSLDEAQRRVIQEIADGIRRGERRPLRVLACAGAGKTKTMVTGVAAIVRENYLPANDVIMTTFTKAATGEMRTRLGGMLRLGAVAGVEYEERGQRRWSRGGVNVTTYHSLALRRVLALVQTMPALRRPHGWATALNLDVKDRFREAKNAAPPAGVSPDQLQQVANIDLETLWERIVSRGEIPGLPKNTPPVQERFKGSGLDPKSVATVIEVYRAHGATTPAQAKTLTTLAAIDDQHAYAFELYNAVKRALPAWDFADVLQAYHDVVRDGADRVRFLVVDEAQDNNPVQMAIARFLTRNHPQGRVVYVGDVRQSIYGFRGADPSILAKADLPEDQGGENAITLELATNYRSTGPVVSCGNRVVHGEPWSVGSPARAARPDLGHVEFFSEPGPVSRARRIAEDIADRLSTGAKPSDFAVLSRKRSAMGPLEVFFLAKNIPVKIQGGSPFFRIKVIQRIMGILRLANAADLRNVVQRPIESILKADFYRLFRDFVPGRFRRASVEGVFTAAVRSPATIVDDLADWFDDETSKRYGRALLWSKEPDGARPMEEGFEAFLRALGEAKGSDPKAVVWAVVRELHGAGLVEIPDFNPEDPAVPAAPEMPEGDVAATVAAATSGESDREMVAALAEVAVSVGNVASICALSLKDQLKDVEEDVTGTAADVESAKVDDANRVVVSTIHASKGLEYPTVYLFAGAKEIPANPEADRAEELRILYVGVTRARNRLVVCTDGGATPWMDRLRPPEEDGDKPPPPPKPEPEAEVPTAPTGPGVDTINAMPEVKPEPVVEADPLLDDFLRLRKVIGEQHPDLLPAFDRLKPDVLRAMTLVRDEVVRQREREAKAEGAATPPEDVEPVAEAPEAPEAPAAPEAQARLVDTVMTGRCFVQVRYDRNVHGGPVTPVDKTKPVQIPDGTQVVCERDGAFTVGYVSAATPAGWAESKAWTKSESNKALAEIGPYLDQLTERWLRRVPPALRDDVKAAALWSMAAGGASIRKTGMRYTAGANNELPGSWRRVIDDLAAQGVLREHSTKTTTEWSWVV